MTATTALLLLLLLLGASSQWQQERFVISFLEALQPPAASLPSYYNLIRSLNVTTVLGWGKGRTDEVVESNLAAAGRAGLDSIVSGWLGNPTISNSSNPALLGYLVFDEPEMQNFSELASWSKIVRADHPDKLQFFNLVPNYGYTADYANYVSRFVEEVNPDVLCFDHYPSFDTAHGNRTMAGYRANLAVFRAVSLKAGIPMWNYFKPVPIFGDKQPTEAQMRWQTLTSLAYGSKGLMYFNYPPGTFVNANGTLGPLSDVAKRVNSVLLTYAGYLLHAVSTDVVWLNEHPATHSTLGKGIITRVKHTREPYTWPYLVLPRGVPVYPTVTNPLSYELLIGSFTLADGRAAALLQNQNPAGRASVTVTFANGLKHVVQVDPSTGRERPLASADVSLEGGSAELFIEMRTGE
jgi:hypothetical protein